MFHLQCKKCKEQEVTTTYYGESARTGFDRGADHYSAMRNGVKNHPVVAHFLESHPQEQPEAQMKILRVFDKPLERQAMEGHMISMFKGKEIMNSRGDWGQNLPPEMVVEHNGRKRRNPGGERKMRETDPRCTSAEVKAPDLGAENPPKPPKRRKVLQPIENCPPIRSKALTVKEIIERMKEIKVDARRDQDSNSGAGEGASNLQNWGPSSLLATDLEGSRPTEGGLGKVWDEDVTMRC